MDGILPGGLQGRSETEEDSSEDRDAEREEQDCPIIRNVVGPWEGFGNHLQQELPGEKENRQTSDSAEQRKQQTLRKQLANEPHSGRSQRLTNRHFSSSRASARQQKIRDVDTGDKQNDDRCAQQQQQQLPDIADHRVAQGKRTDGLRAFGRIVRGKLSTQRRNQYVEPALCGRNR